MPPERGRLWQRTVDYATDTLLRSAEATSSPLVLGSTARLVASAALAVFGEQPESRAYDRADALPATVRRAVAYIETNPDLDLAVADIARASHVSIRALQLAFRRHLGTTPMRYLRRVRLDLARTDLQHAVSGQGTTVTTVATRWGYGDLSRFAADYRAAYGEHPHATLRRSGL